MILYSIDFLASTDLQRAQFLFCTQPQALNNCKTIFREIRFALFPHLKFTYCILLSRLRNRFVQETIVSEHITCDLTFLPTHFTFISVYFMSTINFSLLSATLHFTETDSRRRRAVVLPPAVEIQYYCCTTDVRLYK